MRTVTSVEMRHLFLWLALLLLIACTRQWYLSVDPSPEGAALCFSSRPNCSGEGIQFSVLEVAEVDQQGERQQVMWSIQGNSERQADYLVKRLVYGHTPPGWVEVEPAKELIPNATYSVLGEYFFTFDASKRYTVQSREQFYQQEQQ